MTRLVGHLVSAWRYPVSCAGGERLLALEAGRDGLAGDRQFAVIDAATRQPASPERERRWHPATWLHARLDAAGSAEVKLPDGGWCLAAAAAGPLSKHFGFPVEVQSYASGIRHRYRPGHAHLLTTASMAALQAAVPGSSLDPARFRPNLLVETLPGLEGTVEQDWIGHELQVGGARLAVNKPCGRCSFTSLPQHGLPLDREILRALIRRHERNFGVICHIVGPGRMMEGDMVTVL